MVDLFKNFCADRALTATASLIVAGVMANTGLAQTIEGPEGCEAYATVHKDACFVTSYFRCESQIEVLTHLDGKLVDTHIFGPDWDLAGYIADGGQMGTQAVAGSPPEASLTDALATGESTGVREVEFSTGVLKGEKATIESRLTMGSDTIEISGTTLRVGDLSRKFIIQKNGVTSTFDFEVFATEDASLFIEGRSVVDQFGRETVFEWTPRKIAYPGEPGFLAAKSEIGCD